jgi:hypothetical protein
MGGGVHLGLDMNEEPMKGNDVDDQPTPIIKLLQTYDYYPITIRFCNGAFFRVHGCRYDEHAIFQ